MSRNFSHFIQHFAKKYESFGFFLAWYSLPFHFGFCIFTQKQSEFQIKNKYKYVSNGFTRFMIISNNDIHYEVCNNLWFWKWNSIEDWCKIQQGDTINVTYFGYRIPLLGLFPSIVDTVTEKNRPNKMLLSYLHNMNPNEVDDIMRTPHMCF